MIVPQTKLLVWVAAVLLPLSLLLAIAPGAIVFIGLAAGVFCAIVALDAVRAPKQLRGITASFQDITRLTLDREGMLDILLEKVGLRQTLLRLGVDFPSEIAAPYRELDVIVDAVDTPDKKRGFVVHWPCTGLRRGKYALEGIYVQMRSPLGLWAAQTILPARAEIRVYPNLMKERRHLAALFLNRGSLGIHAQRQMGKGREVEKLREYFPGDNYEDIYWKTTAKRGFPITKVYQIERTQEVYVAIDASRLSARTVHSDASQLERFITAAMVLGLVAEKQGDLFGVLTFDDQVRRFVRAKNGKAHYSTCRDALYTVEPRMVNPDFAEAFSFIRLRLRRRALIVFLTSLDDPVLAESFQQNAALLARHHVVLVNMLNQPGVAPLFSAPDVDTTDDLYQRLGGHLQWQKLRELERVLKRRGVSLALLDNERLCPQLVSQYIGVKRRQVL